MQVIWREEWFHFFFAILFEKDQTRKVVLIFFMLCGQLAPCEGEIARKSLSSLGTHQAQTSNEALAIKSDLTCVNNTPFSSLSFFSYICLAKLARGLKILHNLSGTSWKRQTIPSSDWKDGTEGQHQNFYNTNCENKSQMCFVLFIVLLHSQISSIWQCKSCSVSLGAFSQDKMKTWMKGSGGSGLGIGAVVRVGSEGQFAYGKKSFLMQKGEVVGDAGGKKKKRGNCWVKTCFLGKGLSPSKLSTKALCGNTSKRGKWWDTDSRGN